MDALAPRRGEVVLDVGCGAGQTVLQLADRVGLQGRVIGVDIAHALVEVARERAGGRGEVEFVEGDVAAMNLGATRLDAVFSRFGVMAFADPVAAFTHLRRMLKRGGRLAFVCWRSLVENELDLLPLRAAGLEALADPTPFSLETATCIHEVLAAAAFTDVNVVAHDQAVTCGDLEETLNVLLAVGPLGRIVREAPERRAAAQAHVRQVLVERGDPARVSLAAAVWVVTAKAP